MEKIVRRTTAAGEPLIISYLHSVGRKKGVPISTTFEITSRCNFDCKMCYIHTSDCNRCAENELSTEQWIDIARQARDAGTVFALITGGEPLLRRDFSRIYSAIKEMGMLVSVNTNGSLVKGEIAELFKQNPPVRLNISLYGASGKTYTDLCGGDYYAAVVENIKNMAEAGIQIKLNMGINPLNCGDLEQMLKIAKDLGLHETATTYLYPPSRRIKGIFGSNPCRFSADEAAYYKVKYDYLSLGREEFLKRAEKIENGLSLYDECSDPAQEGSEMLCRAGKTTCWINYKGEMNACGLFSNGDCSVTELGYKACWEKIRENTAAIKTPAKCVGCRYKKLCPTCAAVCKCETGYTHKAPDYVCELSQATAKYLKLFGEKAKNETEEGTVSEECLR